MAVLNVFLIACLLPFSSWAKLGEKSSSVSDDESVFSTKTHTESIQSNFTVHTLTSEGLTIREYVGANDQVFAVTWKGIAHPDMEKILGSYLHEYQNAVIGSAHRKGNRRIGQFTGDHVVVEKSGVMSRARGRAYLPQNLPKGVNLNEIQ